MDPISKNRNDKLKVLISMPNQALNADGAKLSGLDTCTKNIILSFLAGRSFSSAAG